MLIFNQNDIADFKREIRIYNRFNNYYKFFFCVEQTARVSASSKIWLSIKILNRICWTKKFLRCLGEKAILVASENVIISSANTDLIGRSDLFEVLCIGLQLPTLWAIKMNWPSSDILSWIAVYDASEYIVRLINFNSLSKKYNRELRNPYTFLIISLVNQMRAAFY